MFRDSPCPAVESSVFVLVPLLSDVFAAPHISPHPIDPPWLCCMLVYSRTLPVRSGYYSVSFRTLDKVPCRDPRCRSRSFALTIADTDRSPTRPLWVAAILLPGATHENVVLVHTRIAIVLGACVASSRELFALLPDLRHNHAWAGALQRSGRRVCSAAQWQICPAG